MCYSVEVNASSPAEAMEKADALPTDKWKLDVADETIVLEDVYPTHDMYRNNKESRGIV